MLRIIVIVLGVVLIIAVAVFALRQIRGPDEAPVELGVDLNEIKPETWITYGDGLQRVNLDDDPELEWLLFYRYDNAPLGGVIYDGQTAPYGDKSIPISNQTPSYLVPYSLLPDYSFGKTNGYLGEADVDFKQIFLSTDVGAEQPPEIPRDRLLVRGKRLDGRINRFSVFQWMGLDVGYAGAHANTPGWFSLERDTPNDWVEATDWLTENSFPEKIWAWEPQADRSATCRRILWILKPSGNANNPDLFLANYPASDISFCQGEIPNEPAFPEGQVLAFLFDGDAGRWDTEETQQEIPSFKDASVTHLTAPEVLDENIGDPLQVSGEVNFLWESIPYRMYWTATMIAPENIKETAKWRITSLVDR